MNAHRGLTREMAALWRLGVNVMQWRRARGSLWLSWFLLALAIMFIALGLASEKPVQALGFGAGICFAFLVLMWWTFLLMSIREQYHPAAARLIPRLPQRLLAFTIGCWLLCSMLMALTIGVAATRPALVFIVTALVLVEMTLSHARLLLFVFAFHLSRWIGIPVEAWGHWLLKRHVGFLLLLALLALEGGKAHRGLFGPPGTLPTFDVQAAAVQAAQEAVPLGQEQMPFSHGQLFDVVLGSPSTWRARAWGGTLLAAIALVVGLALRGDAVKLGIARVVMILLLAGTSVGFGDVIDRLYRTAREQAVLRLTGNFPSAIALNTLLARCLLKRFLGTWAYLMGIAAVAMLLTGAGPSSVAQVVGMFSFPLMTAGYGLRDYSRTRRSEPLIELVGYLFAVSALVFAAMSEYIHFPLVVIAGIVTFNVLVASAFARWRWRRMVAAPPAFPAGRNRAKA